MQRELTCRERSEKGLSIRTVRKMSCGFASNDGFNLRDIADTCERSKNLRNLAPPSEWTPERPSSLPKLSQVCDEELQSLTAPELMETVRSDVKQALSSPKIRNLRETTILSRHSIAVVNSSGLNVDQQLTSIDTLIQVTAGSGSKHASLNDTISNVQLKGHSVVPRIIRTAERAAKLANATKIRKLLKLPVVISPNAFAKIVGSSLALALCIDNFDESFLGRFFRKQIASKSLSICDDGTLSGGRFSSMFDAEGIPRRRTVLIRNGLLCGRLSNVTEASIRRMHSTGNGNRGRDWDHRLTPYVGHTNLVVEPDHGRLDDFVRETNRGVLLEDLNVTPSWSDPQLSGSIIEAYTIKSGEISACIRHGAFVIDLIELLNGVTNVGKEVTRVFDTSCPPILVSKGITIFPA